MRREVRVPHELKRSRCPPGGEALGSPQARDFAPSADLGDDVDDAITRRADRRGPIVVDALDEDADGLVAWALRLTAIGSGNRRLGGYVGDRRTDALEHDVARVAEGSSQVWRRRRVP